jgi:hypothetical protein
MKKIVLAILLFVFLFSGAAANAATDYCGEGITLGAAVRLMDNYDFIAADIPLFNWMFPIYNKYLQVIAGTHCIWGMSDFFFDPTAAIGFQWYPIGKTYSVHGTAHLGTFLFNNITLMAGTGVDIDIPFGENGNFFVGVEYFYRKVYRVIQFMGGDHWYISSSGIAIRLGLRCRVLE